MPDAPFYAIEAPPEELVQAMRPGIGMILAQLPETPHGAWYRFRFDVCNLPGGMQVVHVRHYPIEAPELDIHHVSGSVPR